MCYHIENGPCSRCKNVRFQILRSQVRIRNIAKVLLIRVFNISSFAYFYLFLFHNLLFFAFSLVVSMRSFGSVFFFLIFPFNVFRSFCYIGLATLLPYMASLEKLYAHIVSHIVFF